MGLAARRANPGLVRSTWWLVRARWLVARNAFFRGSRWRRLTLAVVAAAIGFLAVVALGVSYVVTRGIVNITEDPTRADVVVASSLSGGLVLAIMVSFTVALAALYLSADLDLLLSAPAPRRAVFASKLIGGLLPTHAVVVLITFVPLWGHGLAMGYGRVYYVAVLVALLVLPVLPAAVGAMAVMNIVRRVSAHRLGEVVGLVVVAMTLTLALVAGGTRELQEALTLNDLLGLLERFRNPLSPAEWLTSGITAAARGNGPAAIRWFALTFGISGAALVPLFIWAEDLYYDGWTHMQSADRRREATGGRLPWNRVDRAADLSRPSGWFRWLPAPTVAVLRKDFRVTPRDLTNMAQVLSPLAIGVFFVLQQLLYPIRVGGADVPQPFVAPLLAMLSAGLATGVSAMVTARFGLTAFSAEGRSYWLLKSAPISRAQLLQAKFLLGYIPYLIAGFSLVVLLEGARSLADARAADVPLLVGLADAFRLELLLYAFAVVAILGAGMLSLTLALGSARPNMRWDTPHEMLTPDVGCLSLVLYGAYGAAAGPALMLPAAVAPFAVIEHPALVWVLGLAVGGGVTAAVVVASWRLALTEAERVGG